MLKPQPSFQSQFSSSSSSTQTPSFLLHKPFLHGNGNSIASLPILFSMQYSFHKKNKNVRIASVPGNNIKAVATASTEKATSVKAIVTVKLTVGGLLSSLVIDRDDITDLLGKTLLLELVSAQLDPKTGLEKETIKGYAHRTSQDEGEVKYESAFEVPADFGEVGAIFVENEHHKEMYLKDIILDGFPNGPVNLACNSWVHSKYDYPQKRVFFTNKSYLPLETPEGLRRLRQEELIILRGNGQGERKTYERVYDYDVYNDIGNPDSSDDLKRPVLGGKQHPYPRRCRTGRPRSDKDPLSEKTSSNVYVPRDECFSEVKQLTFSAKAVYSVLHALVPSLEIAIVDSDLGFPYFTAIDSLFNEGVNLPPPNKAQNKGLLSRLASILPRLVKAISATQDGVLRFETPETMDRDKFFWFRDEEFARQTLAGLNPCSIRLVTEWPLKSKLDPKIYGPQESAITTELIEREIKGFCSVKEAINQKKLYILDYHDLFLPYVSKVRELKGTTLYGSRTIFFLTPTGTLRPLAIELTRPPMDGKPQWREVFTPCWDATGVWMWRLAKAHVLAHDSGYHQLVSHWLRTHCCTEPYIIATNRQLSVMHPIYRLLHPHFRYTMEINALAREALINAGGIIESSFSPGKYSMEFSSVAYDQQWQFNLEALPADLINRGLAVEDPTAPHGLKLTIEDYPFANDGLLLWDSIKDWVSDYVNYYYPNPRAIGSDQELQEWWTEIRTVGHGDKKDESWWPVLKTPEDLIQIITTIVWVTSGHHAAVNFGQYTYAGYFPNRPTIARTNMPSEEPSEEFWTNFLRKPEGALLQCFPSQIQATRVMAVLDILSNHSPDEEYLGEAIEPAWAENPHLNSAFERFSGRLKQIEGIIDERNANRDLKNRNGAGIVPYELLKPFSEPGVTGKGVPYSISI
ncbi:linoleate 13S-lipoxygenase 2-1, chloroplastic-like isoform X3 [Juglans microcarpa x Juglans regia]|uniref:linoleate 13S-lipoxygenase 2-1, chloroplastic-like isoform X3 n=1 Tax=Juglans microcarpa x Juglans regia TaxID=2249226 RepID=UPI001B7EA5E1|nr:linoleate 13S-lipoxygenase 2-1, chloroplastic-like isoform X3 [Juglans microcarpa x Juglans regia]